MQFLNELSFGEKIFFLSLVFNIILLLFYYFFSKKMIVDNKEYIGELLFNDGEYIEKFSLEEIFIFTSSLARVFISYIIEIKILKKEKKFFFKEGESSPTYIYPNLNFINAIRLIENFPKCMIFNVFSFFIVCSIFLL
ncbi:hypothetical protein [Acinetobacter vivianii]|uniref:hypothetical protein n=1 Tax=Acinetobacter vivianii TaxID=1776742 RepID=UPI002DB84E30|nr:hypothetical protein [Acinetobacter vivianii]MEB6479299.1 hypothetical protein [Acinetobacter vivianii]MEB6656870.1 hypothetical protein [Acinetobacter vivianii]